MRLNFHFYSFISRKLEFHALIRHLKELFSLSAGIQRSVNRHDRILIVLVFGILFLGAFGLMLPGLQTENQPLATLTVDVENNFINLSDVSQAITQDLSPNTDYTISIASSAKSGDVQMPVMILRGDADKGAVWEFLHNGALRQFNTGFFKRIYILFIDSDVSDNSDSAAVIIKQEGKTVATLSLDAKESCLDLANLSQVAEQKLKPDTEYEVAVTSTAVIGPVSLPVMVIRGDKDMEVDWEFMKDGDIINYNFGSNAWMKALFVGAGGYKLSGKAEITFSLPPSEGKPDNDK